VVRLFDICFIGLSDHLSRGGRFSLCWILNIEYHA